MSGIFVDENDTFDITVHYKEDAGTITVLEKKEEACKSLTVTFKQPDFATAQSILNASTYVGDTGDLSLNMMHLKVNLLYQLAESWDAKDDKGNVLPMRENINKLRTEIARALVDALILKQGENII